jgi:hypothetical protein
MSPHPLKTAAGVEVDEARLPGALVLEKEGQPELLGVRAFEDRRWRDRCRPEHRRVEVVP